MSSDPSKQAKQTVGRTSARRFLDGTLHGRSAWLLDGHNILYAARSAFTEDLIDGHPGTAARTTLIERVAAAFSGKANQVFLHFDGREARSESPSPVLQVLYSGGDGEQRADRAILSQVRELLAADDPPPTIIVVTRDLKLARQARKRGATVMEPGDFLAMLSDSPTTL